MNGHNTHSETHLIEGTVIHIDGVPDTCNHKWNGDTVFISQSGKRVEWHTYHQWRTCTSEFRNRLIQEYHQEIEDPIVGGWSTCSKCKKEFEPPQF